MEFLLSVIGGLLLGYITGMFCGIFFAHGQNTKEIVFLVIGAIILGYFMSFIFKLKISGIDDLISVICYFIGLGKSLKDIFLKK